MEALALEIILEAYMGLTVPASADATSLTGLGRIALARRYRDPASREAGIELFQATPSLSCLDQIE